MTPNVFISSTIADLHYLREALREAVEDLAYRPVMSEYGEVGYISPETAADSCFRTVKQCHLVVLVIGRRYGAVLKDGLSVTHHEFLAAHNNRIPIITFVESDVLNFKQVFDVDREADLWKKFPGMDNAQATFGLIELVRASPQFNGMFPVTSAADAKRLLKVQIADFVGDRLAGLVLPIRTDVQDVLAEIKGLRSELEKAGTAKPSPEITKRIAVFRFLLEDNAASFKKLLERLFGDVDSAIPHLVSCPDVKSVVESAGFKVVMEERQHMAMLMLSKGREMGLRGGYSGGDGFYWLTSGKELFISPNLLAFFDNLLSVMKSEIK